MRALMVGLILASSVAASAQPPNVRWTASGTQAVVAGPSKKDILAKLKTLQDQQIGESTDLDNAIHKQLNETLRMELDREDLGVAGRRTNLVTKKIEELNKRRAELNARREIVDRVIFQIDSKWNGQKLKDFLVQTFIEMASTDLSDGRDNRLWKAFTYLSMVMREVPESNDDLVALFEGYLKYSSVLDPKSPADFIASRNYTNGLESETARVSTREEAVGTSRAPIVLKTNLGVVETPKPPAPSPANAISATEAASEAAVTAANGGETVSGATSAAPPSTSGSSKTLVAPVVPPVSTKAKPTPGPTPPVQATPAPPPFVGSQTTPIQKAQAQTGQAPMPAQPAGQADSPKSLDKR